MKLIRFGKIGNEKSGIITSNNEWLDVSEFGEQYDESFFESGGLERLKKWITINRDKYKLIDKNERLGSPICRPSKLVCIGLNYASHAEESGMEIPKEPIIFMKATSAIVGPNDNLELPKGSEKTDWEVELAFVISKKAKNVSSTDAMDYVAGYLLHNDYSERHYQLERGGQWVKGKSYDTFAPLGPYFVPKEGIEDVNNLNLWLTVNGEKMQDSNTSDFIFKIPELVSYLSQFMTLLPGDVVSTGTPFGVGLGFNPPKYLKKGDVVELGIEHLGQSKQQVI